MTIEGNTNIKLALEALKEIMQKQNNIYNLKFKQLYEIISKGSQNHLNLIGNIYKILEQSDLTKVNSKLFNDIGKINEKETKALNELFQNIIFNKDETKLEKDELNKLYQDLEDLLKMI